MRRRVPARTRADFHLAHNSQLISDFMYCIHHSKLFLDTEIINRYIYRVLTLSFHNMTYIYLYSACSRSKCTTCTAPGCTSQETSPRACREAMSFFGV